MGIALGSTFTMNAALPIDERFTVADITERNAILAGRRYEGLLVYVVADETNYQLVGGITNSDWTELSGSGGGSSDVITGKELLSNNSVNNITDIGEYLSDASCLIIDYYIFRRTDSAFKKLSGRIVIEGVEDAATNPDKWQILEASRSGDINDLEVIFSLDDVDTEKSILVATLDNMSGANHVCTFYYKLTKLTPSGTEEALLNNTANSVSAIGDYLANTRCILVDYYIYRRTDSSFKTLSGKLFLEGVNDAVLNSDKWQLFEAERSEGLGASGITFSLDDIDTEKSILVVNLDNMAGSGHVCTMYYNLTELSA